jgi:hypothetical protein
MLTTYHMEQDTENARWMPKPAPPSKDTLYGCSCMLSDGLLESCRDSLDGLVQHTWSHLYHEAIGAVTNVIMGRTEHFVVRYIPSIIREMCGIQFIVKYEIVVCPTRTFVVQDIYIPTFEYDHRGQLIEWRCGHCTSPNPVEKRHCTQCGAPRALLIQEMSK